MRLVVATKNEGKLKEFSQMLGVLGIEVISLKDLGIEVEVVEDGSTFEENAIKKAKEICNVCGEPSLADDSGLKVDYLNGKPGVYSDRFAGPNATDQENNKKLLELLAGVPEAKRTAKFVSVIAVAFPEGKTITTQGECEGIILNEPKGEEGFGYDPLFYYSPLEKTFAQIDKNEKNKISHRGKALEKLKEKLKYNIL